MNDEPPQEQSTLTGQSGVDSGQSGILPEALTYASGGFSAPGGSFYA